LTLMDVCGKQDFDGEEILTKIFLQIFKFCQKHCILMGKGALIR